MKIFYASDTHAAESTFRKFTNAGPFYKADMVIYGGDFVGAVVPIVKTKEGYYEATYYGSTVRIKDEKELPGPAKTLRCWFLLGNPQWEEIDRIDENDVERITKELQVKQIEEWTKLMDERFKRTVFPV